jgi:hypothetical protein
MKALAIALALAGSLIVPALAQQVGGISGTVVDAQTGQPIPHAKLYYYKAPYLEKGPNEIRVMETNSHGFFSNIVLQPGRYVVMARFPNKVEGCAVDDVMSGEVTRLHLVIGRDVLMCSGPSVHPITIDPNTTADVYRI